MPSPDLRLTVGGAEYAGWKTARITRSIEAVAGAFELSISDRWAGRAEPWPIPEEEECSLSVDGETLITGYVDKRSPSFSPDDHTLVVSGRDRTGALVDCSAALSTWEFANISILTLAKRLCEPFGIRVTKQEGLIFRVIDRLAVNPGESAFETLERACRMAGALPVSDGQGGLVLTRAGTRRAVTALVEGQNMAAGGADYDATGRYRRYLVVGQHGGAEDEFSGESAAFVWAQATDPNVRRAYRVLVVRPEAGVLPEHAKGRAQWEAKIRAARGDAVSATVQGWKQADGSLWPVNALIQVRSPFLGIDGEMLISQVVYGITDQRGTTTDLSLKRPDAFLPEPVVPKGLWKELVGGVHR